jgi:cytochrome P450
MHAAVASAIPIADLPCPPGLPLLGNALQIELPHLHQRLETWRQRYGDAYRVQVWGQTMVVFADPEVTAAALRERPATFSRTNRLVRVATEMHFDGLFSSNGDKWRRQRPLVMAAFDPGHVRNYFPTLAQVAQRLAGRWQRATAAGQPIPLQADLMRYTVDVIAGLAFGADINTLEGDADVIQAHMDRILPAVFQRAMAPFPWWRWVRTPAVRRLEADLAAMQRAVQGFITAARQRLQDEPALRESPRNLIEAMIAKRDEPGSEVDDECVAANVATMLLAGEDTTAHTLAWLLHLVAQQPEVLVRLRDEVREALGDDRVPTRLDQLERLFYVQACIHESMRLKPVAPMLPHQAARDTVVAGVEIPQGTLCIFLLRAPALDAQHFAQPERFEPERWLAQGKDPATTLPASPKRISMPFGAGPRMCPGRYLALLEIKMAIATLFGSFDLVSVQGRGGKGVDEHLAFTMAPTPLSMKLRTRQDGPSPAVGA